MCPNKCHTRSRHWNGNILNDGFAVVKVLQKLFHRDSMRVVTG
jgi:hypothetical protein